MSTPLSGMAVDDASAAGWLAQPASSAIEAASGTIRTFMAISGGERRCSRGRCCAAVNQSS
jgi:hypothetical protein